MQATGLFVAKDTSPRMREVAESLPPYDLLKAYREATQKFNTTDIVLVVVNGNLESGLMALPRATYVEEAFRRWNEKQRRIHPLASGPAHKRVSLPEDAPAFWLVAEFQEDQAIACCAIGTYRQAAEPAVS